LNWCVCFVRGMWYGMCKVQRVRTRGGLLQPGAQRGRAFVEVKYGAVCGKAQKRAVARSARKSEGRRWKKGRKRRGRSRMPPFDYWKPPFDHR
jgi:hypothetical protein